MIAENNHWKWCTWTVTLLADSSASAKEDGVVGHEGKGDGQLLAVFAFRITDNWLPKLTATSKLPPLKRDGDSRLPLLPFPPEVAPSPELPLPKIKPLLVSTRVNGLDDDILLSLLRCCSLCWLLLLRICGKHKIFIRIVRHCCNKTKICAWLSQELVILCSKENDLI